MLTLPAPVRTMISDAPATIRNPKPMKSRAQENFAGEDGSRSPSLSHSSVRTGARSTRKMELSAWKSGVGTSQPNTWRSVKRSAKRLKLEPACSKPPQNRVENTNSAMIASRRLRSMPGAESVQNQTKRAIVPRSMT
jgi:hypothetical protein